MSIGMIVQKTFRALITVLALVTFVFVILRVSGDPAVEILGVEAGPEALEAYREKWGLNKPIWEQYIYYFANMLRGDFGTSLIEGRDALEVVADRLPKTLTLMGWTALFTFLIGME